MNWNILAGGGNRVPSIVSHIQSHNPDLSILTEYRRGDSGVALKTALLPLGYMTTSSNRLLNVRKTR